VVAVTVVLGGALAVAVRAHTARTVTQTAADLGALAAAQALPLPAGVEVADGAGAAPAVGGSGDACALAAEVAGRHGTRLTACAVRTGGVVDVTVEQDTVLGVARATARAGPADA
jgi:hypothetical protein